MITVSEPYHLAYLQQLKVLNSGHFDNEVLNDGYHRVLLSRMTKADGAHCDNEVTIQNTDANGNWRDYKSYPADTGPGYCVPSNCGLASESGAVGRRIAKIMDALCTLDHTCTGKIQSDCDELRLKMLNVLTAQGWRIRVRDNDRYQVLPPNGKRNDGN